jgi:hypothetical protein
MNTSISLERVCEPDGEVREIVVENYHCDTCNSFVFSTSNMDGEEEKSKAFFLKESIETFQG